MGWTEHAIWWQVYPLGAVGAPIRTPDVEPAPHRLDRLVPWLDHVQRLGTNGVLLGPVFASSTHGYDTTDHFAVDPRLGTDDDLAAFVAAAHERGLRVLLDGVFNHVGVEHPLVAQVLAEGRDGPRASFLRVDWDHPDGPRTADFEGHRSRVALNHDDPAVAAYVVDVMRHWLARGADGWRLDAAYTVPPQSKTWPHAARAFQRAAPDDAGLGVTISMPGSIRSSQVSMPSGLPGRTAKTTTDDDTTPLFSPASQSSATRPSTTRRVTSLVTEKWT